mmetsp:Transcript_12577/g.27159  ORF Transcript_12577/g.27159 Transcript_12577/m.27159 type:complete len:303 (+) Transcript_12577:129-1037(+)
MSPVSLPFYQVDAFSKVPFGGNPAAVVLLRSKLEDDVLQKIAAENNLAETAFVALTSDQESSESDPFASRSEFNLRWFTPTTEVPLCGHATLASAAALFDRGNQSPSLQFHTLSGVLSVSRQAASPGAPLLAMTLPLAAPCDPVPAPCADLSGPFIKACTGGLPVKEVLFTGASNLNYVVVVLQDATTRSQLESIQPDIEGLLGAVSGKQVHGVIVTAPGSNGYDVFSRFFGPWMGISEDHVTGSAHSVLGPYWETRLDRSELSARQCSERGGELQLRVDRTAGKVTVCGAATVVIRGTFCI